MRKEPAHRYQSASELVQDVQNYLSGDPLIAGPESSAYRIRKFVRRNQVLVTGVTAVLIVLIAGIVISTIFAIGQARERAKAIRAQEAEAKQRQIAEAISEFLNNDFIRAIDPKQARGREVTVREVVYAASKKLKEKFKDAPLVEASIRATIGETYRSLGLYKEAQPHLERAYEIRLKLLGKKHPDSLNSMYDLGALYQDQGRYEDSKRLFETVVETSRNTLGPDHPDTGRYTKSLAWLYLKLGSHEEIERISDMLVREDSDEIENISTIESMRYERYIQAEDSLVNALNMKRKELTENHPETLMAMQNLASLYMNQRRFSEAESLTVTGLEKATSVLDANHPATLLFQTNLALIYSAKGDYLDSHKFSQPFCC